MFSSRKIQGQQQSLSHVRFFVTPWTVTHQAPLSKGFPRQEYWSGLSFPPPGDYPDPGIEPMSRALAGDYLPLSQLGTLQRYKQHFYFFNLKLPLFFLNIILVCCTKLGLVIFVTEARIVIDHMSSFIKLLLCQNLVNKVCITSIFPSPVTRRTDYYEAYENH